MNEQRKSGGSRQGSKSTGRKRSSGTSTNRSSENDKRSSGRTGEKDDLMDDDIEE
jgi:hypothetical protein